VHDGPKRRVQTGKVGIPIIWAAHVTDQKGRARRMPDQVVNRR
jgi:hypothetical protein